MWRFAWVGMIGVMLALGRPAYAQPPRGNEDVKSLEAELSKLRNQIQELEVRLKKSMGDAAAPDRKGPGGPPFVRKGEGKGPGGGFPGGPPFMRKEEGKGPGGGGPGGPPFARKDDFKKPGGAPFARMEERGGRDSFGPPPGGPPWARSGDRQGPSARGPWGPRPGGPPWSRMGESRRSADTSRPGELERRVERILREVEDLQRLIRQR